MVRGWSPSTPALKLPLAQVMVSRRGCQPAAAARRQQAESKVRRVVGKVVFLVPGQRPLTGEHVTQHDLQSFLNKCGAVGFKTPTGGFSQRVDDLPEGGEVELVMLDKPSVETQLGNIQGPLDNDTRSLEFKLERFLDSLASAESGGTPTTALRTAPFQDESGQDVVQLDAAIRAGSILYLGEFKRVLSRLGIVDVVMKLAKIRLVLSGDLDSPDLAAALQGVTHAKLYLGGQVVQAGKTAEDMADLAAKNGITLVLPSGQGLAPVGGPVSAVQL